MKKAISLGLCLVGVTSLAAGPSKTMQQKMSDLVAQFESVATKAIADTRTRRETQKADTMSLRLQELKEERLKTVLAVIQGATDNELGVFAKSLLSMPLDFLEHKILRVGLSEKETKRRIGGLRKSIEAFIKETPAARDDALQKNLQAAGIEYRAQPLRTAPKNVWHE